jgi:hypothetical protein
MVPTERQRWGCGVLISRVRIRSGRKTRRDKIKWVPIGCQHMGHMGNFSKIDADNVQ